MYSYSLEPQHLQVSCKCKIHSYIKCWCEMAAEHKNYEACFHRTEIEATELFFYFDHPPFSSVFMVSTISTIRLGRK